MGAMRRAFILGALRFINEHDFGGRIVFNIDEAVEVWLYNGAGFYQPDEEEIY